VLARRLGYRLWIADVGVAADTSAEALPGILYRRIGAGTRNLAREPAMSVAEARAAPGGWRGSRARRGRVRRHADWNWRDGNRQQHFGGGLARGVHGASAGAPGRRGAGVDDAGMRRKVATIDRALKLHSCGTQGSVRHCSPRSAVRDRAMAGACLGGAALNAPVGVDGLSPRRRCGRRAPVPRPLSICCSAIRSSKEAYGIALEHSTCGRSWTLGCAWAKHWRGVAMSVIEAALALFTGWRHSRAPSVGEDRMSEIAHGAPDHENETKAPPRVARGRKLTEIRLAAGFLTILPLLPPAVAPET